MRLDDDPDITLADMLVFARQFPLPLLAGSADLPTVPTPHHLRLSEPPIVVPDACLSLVDGPLVGL
jgi:hypothetical protein